MHGKQCYAMKTQFNTQCSFIFELRKTCLWFDRLIVTEPKLRPRASGQLVRILGMIDRLEPKVNIMNKIYLQNLNIFPRKKRFANYGFKIKVNL